MKDFSENCVLDKTVLCMSKTFRIKAKYAA